MGTNWLTMVVNNKKTQIAHMGYWDGIPTKAGVNLLTLLSPQHVSQLRPLLSKCHMLSQTELTAFKRGMYTDEELLIAAYPNFFFGDGFELLKRLLCTEESVTTRDDSHMAYDSRLLDWAYVVDYDICAFEVYKGMNTTPLTPSDRFYNATTRSDSEYYGVRCVASYRLDNLPSLKAFTEDARRW